MLSLLRSWPYNTNCEHQCLDGLPALILHPRPFSANGDNELTTGRSKMLCFTEGALPSELADQTILGKY
ncbi:hypothetical protein [Bradyrhizobium liaoningense]|uniref:hypothetical protein n=1 Tax=Bradyrhizobium sp. SMVTL-02 TaxID=3395917 RepID=UPI0018D307C7